DELHGTASRMEATAGRRPRASPKGLRSTMGLSPVDHSGGHTSLRGRGGLDAAAAAHRALRLEGRVLDHSVDQRKQREVPAEPDVVAGVNPSPHLPHQDVARADLLTAEALDTAHLRAGVTSVA